MIAEKVTVTITVETLSVDSVPAMLLEVAEHIRKEFVTGVITADDGDTATWNTTKGVGMMENEESLRKSLEDALPPIVPRHGIQRYGWPYSEGHMANQDSIGQGPPGAFVVGRKVVYPRASLIDWLLSRLTEKPTKAREAR